MHQPIDPRATHPTNLDGLPNTTHRDRFWRDFTKDVEAVRSDPEASAKLDEEDALWDATVGDGLPPIVVSPAEYDRLVAILDNPPPIPPKLLEMAEWYNGIMKPTGHPSDGGPLDPDPILKPHPIKRDESGRITPFTAAEREHNARALRQGIDRVRAIRLEVGEASEQPTDDGPLDQPPPRVHRRIEGGILGSAGISPTSSIGSNPSILDQVVAGLVPLAFAAVMVVAIYMLCSQ